MMFITLLALSMPTLITAVPTNLTQRLNTQGNTVGIKNGDVCWVTKTVHDDGTTDVVIACRSGKRFTPIATNLAATTGTPGGLLYQPGTYIGHSIVKQSTPGLMGSGKRMDYCIGTCSKKRKTD